MYQRLIEEMPPLSPPISKKSNENESSNLKKCTLSVEGMTCSSCVVSIEMAIKQIKGKFLKIFYFLYFLGAKFT